MAKRLFSGSQSALVFCRKSAPVFACSLGLTIGLATSSQVFAQESDEVYPTYHRSGSSKDTDINLFPVATDEEEVEPVSEPGSLSLGVYVNSIYPMGSPFSSTAASGLVQDLNFQVSTGFGIELGYSFSPNFEAALGVGYENFSAQVNSGTDTNQQYERVTLKQFPVIAVARYKFKNLGYSPELEAGAGMGFAKLGISSSNTSIKVREESLSPIHAHAAAGMGFTWLDGTSLHFQLGYAYQGLGSETYELTGGSAESITTSSMSGIFFKGMMRFNF